MYHPSAPWVEKEKRFATLLILSKLLDSEMLEDFSLFGFPNVGGTHEINKRIELDDIFHEIDIDLFDKVIGELSSEGLISSSGLRSYSIDDKVKLNQKIANLYSVGITWDTMRKHYGSDNLNENEKELDSIDLITHSLSNIKEIFVVLNGRYEAPVRFDAINRNGEEAAIKKLHNIAYLVDVPGKRVGYDEGLASNINNGLFRKKQIDDYMKSNGFKKPTLVQKSKEENILVLKNEVPVMTLLTNAIPQQYRSLYANKTK